MSNGFGLDPEYLAALGRATNPNWVGWAQIDPRIDPRGTATMDEWAPVEPGGLGTIFPGFPELTIPIPGIGTIGVEFPSAPPPPASTFAQVPAVRQQPAPTAGLLTGACPPGRVLRRRRLGRDICIKKPHMNVLNPRALARSTRRVSGFLHRVRSTEKALRHAFVGLTPKRRTSRRGGCVQCGMPRAQCAC